MVRDYNILPRKVLHRRVWVATSFVAGKLVNPEAQAAVPGASAASRRQEARGEASAPGGMWEGVGSGFAARFRNMEPPVIIVTMGICYLYVSPRMPHGNSRFSSNTL